jgi:hypothetical protein
MEVVPFQHQTQRASGKLSRYNPTLNVDGHFVFSVDGMVMRGSMFPVEHGYHDSKKAAEFRHTFQRYKLKTLWTCSTTLAAVNPNFSASAL